MRSFIALILIGLCVASATDAAVAKTSKVKAKSAKTAKTAQMTAKNQKPRPSSHLSTNVSFDDSVLRGQYQAPEEALAKVENEKGLQDLIGVRKHFKDRLQEASEQE